MRRAKIVCTLGPATDTPEALLALVRDGMDCARLNFSHGDHEHHRVTAVRVREAAARAGRQVALLQDLCGPKMRVGTFPGGEVTLSAGDEVVLTTRDDAPGDAHRLPVSYEGLARDVRPGVRILLDDGLLELQVIATDGQGEARAAVVTGGALRDHKGLNLPGVDVALPALTAKDAEDLELGLAMGVDFVALSFVRSPEDVAPVRAAAARAGRPDLQVIAKIERPQAVDRLEDIIAAFDGVMVARGDLGVELGPEKVPLVQKRAIEQTNRQGKLVITATQMLDSMIRNPRPTRAEASDVANAVLDGTDALMLSGETAVGRYALESVRMMDTIIREVEGSPRFRSLPEPPPIPLGTVRNAVARAAIAASRELPLAAIVVVTLQGRLVRLISEYRPSCPVVALTPSEGCARALTLHWGVLPILGALHDRTDDMIAEAVRAVRAGGIARDGDVVAITLSIPPGTPEGTNLLHLHTLRPGVLA
ncbi:MAG TPA: pyruvate kinase [Myxococcota bacterium]|nr:pyruvate kinase [Myxococcota bacterium]